MTNLICIITILIYIIQDSISKTYLDIEEINKLKVSEENIKSDKLYTEYLDNYSKLEIELNNTACLFVIREYLNKNKAELSKLVKSNENYSESLFDRIFLDLHSNCTKKITSKEANSILEYKNNNNVFEKLKHLIRFNKDVYNISKKPVFKDEEKELIDYISLSYDKNTKKINKSNNELSKNTTNGYKNIIFIIIACLVILFITKKINKYIKTNDVHKKNK